MRALGHNLLSFFDFRPSSVEEEAEGQEEDDICRFLLEHHSEGLPLDGPGGWLGKA